MAPANLAFPGVISGTTPVCLDPASAVEREPAQRVAQPLVIEDELPDLVGEAGALPPALHATGLHAVVAGRGRPRALIA